MNRDHRLNRLQPILRLRNRALNRLRLFKNLRLLVLLPVNPADPLRVEHEWDAINIQETAMPTLMGAIPAS